MWGEPGEEQPHHIISNHNINNNLTQLIMDSIHSSMCMSIISPFFNHILFIANFTLIRTLHLLATLRNFSWVGLGSVVASPNKISYYQTLIILVGLFILFKIKDFVLKANAVNTIRDVLANTIVKSCACF
ncbi:hypothetical protein VIGAN_06234500 [Vigna angularis var. angularis]|uniref:Uncharacterized protein n=1 Tax=Vigna angularis var. angularis TaxID=157739 RepID=A0A0S3SDV4_PHAAN|nr:hypothetical protein VIGAN_06234500 [Vigna angularis var. angularis]